MSGSLQADWAHICEPNHLLMVALVDDTLVAQVAAVILRHRNRPKELNLDEVGVGDDYRRLGIARTMVDVILKFGQSMGLTMLRR